MKTLNLLIDTLQKVILHNKELYMKEYYKDSYFKHEYQETTTIHECGTAACVLGYAALEVPMHPRAIWIQLTKEIGNDLADSIADPTARERMAAATCFFNRPDWLYEYKHLTSEEPTAQDALDYLLKVKEIVNT
jgi:hypothetical protein